MNNNDKYVFWGAAVSSILFGFGYYNFNEYKKIKNEETIFKNQRIYSPDEIKNIIDKNQPLVKQLFKENNEGNKLIGKRLIIQGRISNKDYINSQIDNKMDVQLAHRVNYEFPYYTNEDVYKIISEKTMNSDYYLKKKEQGQNIETKFLPTIILEKNKVSCNLIIDEEFDKIDKQCYDHANSQMNQDNPSVFKQGWNYIGLFVAGIIESVYHKDIRSILCFRIKVDNCEIGIRNNGILSVLGDVVYDKEKNELTISNPIRVIKNKIEYLEYLRSKMNAKEYSSYIYWILSLSIAGISSIVLYHQLQDKTYLTFLGRQYRVPIFIVNSMRRLKNYLNQSNPNAKISEEIKDNTQDEQKNKTLESVYVQPREEMECIICYQNCRSVIIRPCLHCSMCFNCYKSLSKKQCPVCKSLIRSEVQIFQELQQDQNKQANQNINNNTNIQNNNSADNNSNQNQQGQQQQQQNQQLNQQQQQ